MLQLVSAALSFVVCEQYVVFVRGRRSLAKTRIPSQRIFFWSARRPTADETKTREQQPLVERLCSIFQRQRPAMEAPKAAAMHYRQREQEQQNIPKGIEECEKCGTHDDGMKYLGRRIEAKPPKSKENKQVLTTQLQAG